MSPRLPRRLGRVENGSVSPLANRVAGHLCQVLVVDDQLTGDPTDQTSDLTFLPV